MSADLVEATPEFLDHVERVCVENQTERFAVDNAGELFARF